MTDRQKALLDYHKDLAEFSCLGYRRVFWILDLVDLVALDLAVEFGHDRAQMLDKINATVSIGSIPAATVATPLVVLNAYRVAAMEKPEIADPGETFYLIVLATEGKFTVFTMPKPGTEPTKKKAKS